MFFDHLHQFMQKFVYFSERLDPDEPTFAFCFLLLFFFFFSARVLEGTKFTLYVLFNIAHALFRYCSHTIHGTHSHFIQKKKLKIGPTVLLT